ncbi:MAG: hypothetical protein AB1589_30110 [Cyanobacteriota bacterium]
MAHFEYLAIKLIGSKSSATAAHTGTVAWDNVRLVVTQNGFTTVQTLAGGMDRMEEHLNNQLNHYTQQGWQAITIERPEEGTQSTFLKTTIHCFLKRSLNLDLRNQFDQRLKDSTQKIYQNLAVEVPEQKTYA